MNYNLFDNIFKNMSNQQLLDIQLDFAKYMLELCPDCINSTFGVKNSKVNGDDKVSSDEVIYHFRDGQKTIELPKGRQLTWEKAKSTEKQKNIISKNKEQWITLDKAASMLNVYARQFMRYYAFPLKLNCKNTEDDTLFKKSDVDEVFQKVNNPTFNCRLCDLVALGAKYEDLRKFINSKQIDFIFKRHDKSLLKYYNKKDFCSFFKKQYGIKLS